jgi:hypothetical protein
LVRARDDVPVWSRRYDQNLTDVLAIQDEISRGVVNGLRLTLGRGLSFAKNASAGVALRCRKFVTVMQATDVRNLVGRSETRDLPNYRVSRNESIRTLQ